MPKTAFQPATSGADPLGRALVAFHFDGYAAARALVRCSVAPDDWLLASYLCRPETDLPDRALWSDYQKAYAEALSATSTSKAPWYVIPADHKPYARAVVAEIIVDAINSLNLEYPKVSAEQMEKIVAARNFLEKKDA